MIYTIEEIYISIGRDDKTAGITFRTESAAYNMYGSFIVVNLIYSQEEREKLDILIQNKTFSNQGILRAEYLGSDLSEEKKKSLQYEGFNSRDISEIIYHIIPQKNTFHSTETRNLNKIEIPMSILLKGGDLDWMYGFTKLLVNKGTGLSPYERNFYLAGKFYFEQDKITIEELHEIFNENGYFNENVELEYLKMKCVREEINNEEAQRLSLLLRIKRRDSVKKLDKYLNEAGSSLKKLYKDNLEKAAELYSKVMDFTERRVSISGKHPIYIALDGFLHIFTRHVEEFQINKHFEGKDNFQWKDEDIFSVMGHVIEDIEIEYQKYREENPEMNYSKYRKQSIYFQGDYYSLDIKPNGSIKTFYRNKKTR